MKDYYVVSFSGGKDSTAMLLRMMELGEQIDEVVCCDTTIEFPPMYDHIEKIQKEVEDRGIKWTMLRHPKGFRYLLLDHEYINKQGEVKNGYSWAGFPCRWCTGQLKTKLVDKYFQDLKSEYEVHICIGFAADEQDRLKRENNQRKNYRYPLIEWGWDEATCLQYCYDKGFDWGGACTNFSTVFLVGAVLSNPLED